MFAYSLKIALRYFFSKSSQTVINRINGFAFIMVVIATASLFIVLSAFGGLKDFGLSFSESFDPDYEIQPQKGKFFNISDQLLQEIKSVPEILAVAPQIEEKVFLSYSEKNQVAYLKAVDHTYTSVVQADKLIALGDWLSFDGADVVLGFGIAGNLGVGVYDYSTFLKLTVPKIKKQSLLDQSPFKEVSTIVVGLYQINEDLDKKYVFSRMEVAQNLLELNPQEYSSLVLKTSSKISKEELSAKLVSKFEQPIKLVSRAEQNAALYKMLNVEHLAIYFIFTLVMLIALFNVVGALIMMILDKQDQMKTLLSLGATAQGIHRVFFTLGLLICSIGGGVGLLLGSILILFQYYFPFIYVPGTSLSYPVVFQIENLFIVMGTLMVLGTLSTAWATRGLDKKIKSYAV
ncbi:ABC transporter permease [Flavobacteriaceae bacterium]|nr:ABC transporter permease [Flavobacteriaceae bacterium]MDA8948894.1 ABC transporter permease [Flavobacteriaceae bacterium]MDA9016336.1 ABC transporter permease [Flavobacteriaceae bacterium]MDA9572353.1 ABC transporter permease [Flavobacteriaceae bacterium]MDB3863084.1 ABC transporter permease [Flavobacteriaceae bacterium]